MRIPRRLRLRALLLSAGLGTRLRPLTDVVPKPLLPVAGRPLAFWNLDALRAAGCEAVAINLHHLGEKVAEVCGEAWQGMPLRYSREESLLGTLGALPPLAEFFAEADLVLVVNGDSLCRWPIAGLVRRHLKRSADATLLLSRHAEPRQFGGGVAVRRDGSVSDFRAASAAPREGGEEDVERRVFAGAHVVSPALLSDLGAGPADFVSDLYEPLLAAGGRIQSLATRRAWYDLGTPARYLHAVRRWARGRWPMSWVRRTWVAPGVEVAADARIVRSVVETGVTLGPGARVERSLVLPGARVGADCHLLHAILAPGVRLPPGTSVEHRMVTRQRTGVAPGEGDSVVGDLVYTPIVAG